MWSKVTKKKRDVKAIREVLPVQPVDIPLMHWWIVNPVLTTEDDFRVRFDIC
jgi:hypothetical protein